MELRASFDWRAGQVLARRNRRDLCEAAAADFMADMGRRGAALLRRVMERQRVQFSLLEGPVLRSLGEEGGAR